MHSIGEVQYVFANPSYGYETNKTSLLQVRVLCETTCLLIFVLLFIAFARISLLSPGPGSTIEYDSN